MLAHVNTKNGTRIYEPESWKTAEERPDGNYWLEVVHIKEAYDAEKGSDLVESTKVIELAYAENLVGRNPNHPVFVDDNSIA